MGVTSRTSAAVAAIFMSTVVVSCARPTAVATPVGAATPNPAQLAPHTAGIAIATLPAVGPYRPVTHPPEPLPTTLTATDVAALSPGVRALVTDYRNGKMPAFTFCRLVLAVFDPAGALPARYRDAALTQKDKIALVITMNTAQKKLTRQQAAELTTQLLRALPVH